MNYHRMPIEIESPEESGYQNIRYNLAESSVAELNLGQLGLDLNGIKPEYTTHRGHQGLRRLIAREGEGLNETDILLTGGASMALFIIHTVLLNSGDRMLVMKPNYSSNIAGPLAIGCNVQFIELKMENEWQLDVHDLIKNLDNNTRLISLTYPHNPTGTILDSEKINQLKHLADQFQIPILFDETYRDACFNATYPLLASLHPLFISVISFSKGYGLPGIRMGAVITKDEKLQSKFLAAKELIQICNPPLEETIAYQFYQQKNLHLERINQAAQVNLDILKNWLQQETRIEAKLPRGGVVCFARIKQELDTERFYILLWQIYGTLVGPGHWFDMSDQYMRIGFGYPDGNNLSEGLKNISGVLDELTG